MSAHTKDKVVRSLLAVRCIGKQRRVVLGSEKLNRRLVLKRIDLVLAAISDRVRGLKTMLEIAVSGAQGKYTYEVNQQRVNYRR